MLDLQLYISLSQILFNQPEESEEMDARPAKRMRTKSRGKSAYLKSQKALAVRMVPRPMFSARSFPGPLPNKVSTTLIYNEAFTLNAAAASWIGYVFNANGIFQCNTSTASGQPRGRDEMFELYNHAYVTAAYITVRAMGNATNIFKWGVAVRDDAVAFTTVRDFGEYRNSKMHLMPVTAVEQVITHKCVPHKFLGLRDAFDDSLRNSVAASSTEAVFFHVGCGDAVGGDPAAMTFDVRIIYYVTFTEPKPLAAS